MKNMMCSEAQLGDEIASLAKRLSAEEIPHEHISRLVPETYQKLDNSVRPVGIRGVKLNLRNKTKFY